MSLLSSETLRRQGVAVDTAGGAVGDVPAVTQVDGSGNPTAFGMRRPVLPSNTLDLLGDSITSVNNPVADRGWFAWANVRLGQRIKLGVNAGVFGERSDQIAARVSAVTSTTAGWCHVLAGTNDVVQDRTAAQIQTNLTTIYDALTAAGKDIIAATIPPITGTTTARRAVLYAVNEWIKGQALSRRGFTLIDWHPVLADPSTGDYATGMSYDGTHPGAQGAAAMGRIAATILDPLLPKADLLPGSNADPGNYIPNGMMVGTTGGVATGWGVTLQSGSASTATKSKVARTDGLFGEWQQAVVPAAEDVLIQYALTTNLPAVGTQVQAFLEFETGSDVGVPTRFRLNLQCLDSGFSTLASQFGLATVDPVPSNFRISAGVLRTLPVTVPANTARIHVGLAVATGAGTYRVGRVSLRAV